MNFYSKFWRWFVAMATVLGFITGGMALHEYFSEDEYIIEQKVSPEVMDRVNRGEEVILEKGIRRSDDTGS